MTAVREALRRAAATSTTPGGRRAGRVGRADGGRGRRRVSAGAGGVAPAGRPRRGAVAAAPARRRRPLAPPPGRVPARRSSCSSPRSSRWELAVGALNLQHVPPAEAVGDRRRAPGELDRRPVPAAALGDRDAPGGAGRAAHRHAGRPRRRVRRRALGRPPAASCCRSRSAASAVPIIAFAPLINNWFGLINPLSKVTDGRGARVLPGDGQRDSAASPTSSRRRSS